MSRNEAHRLWRQYVDPGYVDLLEALDFGRCFVRAEGTKLIDDTGREYVDFLAGFGVHNTGHNHPRLIQALKSALESNGASMLNIDAPLAAGRLAERLTALTHPKLSRVSFGNSGAEVADMAIKAARLATGRRMLVSCERGYHGLSIGTLPLLSYENFYKPFKPSPDDAMQIPYNDVKVLEAVCAQHKPAAFFVEPVQGEGGMRPLDSDYLARAAAVCKKYGCVFVVDEIQTGFGRTGKLFATPFPEVVPDILLVGKALSGGMIPASAALISADVWARTVDQPERNRLHLSTFAGGLLAMTTGLEVLKIIEEENLPQKANERGELLLKQLTTLQARHPVIKNVRGRGLMVGIEFQKPDGLLYKAVPEWVRDEFFEQVVAVRLLSEHGFLTQTCQLAPGVLRVEPPLIVTVEECERFVAALDCVLTAMPSYNWAVWSALQTRLSKGMRQCFG